MPPNARVHWTPKVSKELSYRQGGQPPEVRALSWKAQNQLHSRFVRLAARRLMRNKIVVAHRSRTLRLHLGPSAQPELLFAKR
jgi:hypothetical protein